MSSKYILTRHDNATDFLQTVQPLLEENELDNNMMLGLCLGLKKKQDEAINPKHHFVSICQNGIAIAATVSTFGKALLAVRDGKESLVRNLAAYYENEAIDLIGVFSKKNLSELFVQYYTKTPVNNCAMLSHRLETLKPIMMPKGYGAFATVEDTDFLADWLILFETEANIIPVKTKEQALNVITAAIAAKRMYKWVLAGQTVSCAAIMRQTPNIGIVGLVFTPTELRGQGFASGCVWNLSSFILNSGLRYAGLFTDVSNPVSNEIYKKIGYLPFSEFLDVNFCMNDDI